MTIVALTALGVGGASVIGALIGFLFKTSSHKLSDFILSFAAGVMLCAAIVGLILPSLEYANNDFAIIITVLGVFCGALCVNLLDKTLPHLHKLTGVDIEKHPEKTAALNKVLLFVIAIAIHNLPEGIAAGVGFGTGDNSGAFLIASGIALQNIPEGMAIIGPMVAAGISKKRTLLVAIITGLIEVVGTFFGYFAASISAKILPFALAFAGGTMLYVVGDEIIPETHAHGNENIATHGLLIGFCIMLLLDVLI